MFSWAMLIEPALQIIIWIFGKFGKDRKDWEWMVNFSNQLHVRNMVTAQFLVQFKRDQDQRIDDRLDKIEKERQTPKG